VTAAILYGGLVSLFMAVTLSVPLYAFGQAAGATVQAEGAWARRAAAMVMKGASGGGSGNGAVYALLVNRGNVPDALVGAESDAAVTVEIHETYRDMNMMMMRAVRKIDVPVGSKIELKPGGYHVMLLNLKRDLKVGESISVTLHFEKAGRIPVAVAIK